MRDFNKQKYLAIAAIWFERFLECSRTFGTREFSNSVWRFYHSLLNLGEGKLAIRNLVGKYYTEVWYPQLMEVVEADCERSNVSVDQDFDMSNRKLIYDGNEQIQIVHLFEFITQTIQDSGRGWQIFLDKDDAAWDYEDAIQN